MKKILLSSLAMGGLSTSAMALESIGWSFDCAPFTGDALSPEVTAGAGPYAQASWNNHTSFVHAYQGPGEIPFALVDNSGAATTASVTAWTVTVENGWADDGAYAGTDGDVMLMNAYTASSPSLTFSGIPEHYQTNTYRVVVYYKDSSTAIPLTITGSVDDSQSRLIGTAETPAVYATSGYVERTATQSSAGNYTVFKGLNDPSVTISSSLPIYAVQIVYDQLPLDEPTGPSPGDDPEGFLQIATSAPLSWSAVDRAISYKVYLWKASDAEPAEPTATTATPSYDPAENLDASTIYLWKVVVVGPHGETPGPTWTFTTGDGGVPGNAQFPFPDDQEADYEVNGNLLWEAAPNALTYDVYLWLASESKPQEPTWSGAGTSYDPPTDFLASTTYNWQVIAHNEVGSTPDAPVWTFTTSTFYDAGRQSIGWNFNQGNYASSSALGNYGAGIMGFGQYHWNDHLSSGQGNGTVPFTLKDSSGTTTTAQVTAWTSSAANSVGKVAADPESGDSRLMSTYNGSQPSITFSNLPADYLTDRYTVVVYYGNVNDNINAQTISISGSVDDVRSRAVRTGSSADYDLVGFLEGTDANTTTRTNYTVFTDLNDPNFTVTMSNRGISGVQIIKEVGPPNVVAGPLPANAAVDVVTASSLSWQDAGRADSYNVYLWTGEAGSPPGSPTASALTATAYDPVSLAPSTQYFWRVDAVNELGTTTGTVWSFTTGENLPPAVVTGPAPSNALTGVSVGTSLSWSAAARTSSYQLYLWKSSDSPPALESPTASGTSLTYTPPAALLTNTSYSWRVDSVNDFGTTTGTVWTFTTGGVPAVAVSPSPANGATALERSLGWLDWGDAAGATSYQVYLWPSADSPPGTATATVTASRYSPTVLLAASTAYSWRVDSVNSFGTTTGATWTFTTSDVVTSQQSIGWHYDYEAVASTGDTMVPTDYAGVPGYSQLNWNNHLGASRAGGTVPFALVDNSGTATTATVSAWTVFAANGNSTGTSTTLTNSKLTNAWTGNRATITFSGIPADYVTSGYKIIVYYNGPSGPANKTLTLTGSSSDPVVRVVKAAGTASYYANSGFLEAPAVNSSTDLSNFTVFTDRTDASFSIAYGENSGGFNAIQIVKNAPAPASSPYETWATTNGLLGGLTGGDAAFAADPDGDGLANGLEFLLGGQPNPEEPGSNSLSLIPVVEVDEEFITFTFDRDHAAADIEAVVEFSTTLDGDWTEATELNATLETEPGTSTDRVKVTIPKGEANALFVRLRAVDPTPAP